MQAEDYGVPKFCLLRCWLRWMQWPDTALVDRRFITRRRRVRSRCARINGCEVHRHEARSNEQTAMAVAEINRRSTWLRNLPARLCTRTTKAGIAKGHMARLKNGSVTCAWVTNRIAPIHPATESSPAPEGESRWSRAGVRKQSQLGCGPQFRKCGRHPHCHWEISFKRQSVTS